MMLLSFYMLLTIRVRNHFPWENDLWKSSCGHATGKNYFLQFRISDDEYGNGKIEIRFQNL